MIKMSGRKWDFIQKNVVELFCDGGLLSKNPSPQGGTWAWCFVDEHDQRICYESGILYPRDLGLKKITNNHSELYAALAGMHALPDDWSGTIWTDSNVTLHRIKRDAKKAPDSIPERLDIACKALKERLGDYKVKLLSGHPSREQIAIGYKKCRPVSRHNVFCDQLCTKLKEKQHHYE